MKRREKRKVRILKKGVLDLIEEFNFLNNQNYIISSVEKRKLKREFLKDLIWGFYEKYFKIPALYNKFEKKKNKSLKDKLLFWFLEALIIIWVSLAVVILSVFYDSNYLYSSYLLKNNLHLFLFLLLIILFPAFLRFIYFFGLLFISVKKRKEVVNYLFIKSHFFSGYIKSIHFFKIKNRSEILLIISGVLVYLGKDIDEVLVYLFIYPVIYSYYPILLWLLIVIIVLYYFTTRLLLLDIYSSYVLVYKVNPIYNNTFLRLKVGGFQIGNVLYLIKK